MKELSRSVDQAIAWSRSQIEHPTQDWDGKCQSHVRQAYGVDAWARSAIIAWERIPDDQKYEGRPISEAPRGAALYYDIGRYGHVTIAIGKKTNVNCLSNDYVRTGHIDVAPRTLPRWNAAYLGWSSWTPFGVMDLSERGQDWDEKVPSYDALVKASLDPELASPAAFRLAQRLNDLGFYAGVPQPVGIQTYPRKAVQAFQKARGFKVTGDYGPKLHKMLFGVAP